MRGAFPTDSEQESHIISLEPPCQFLKARRARLVGVADFQAVGHGAPVAHQYVAKID